MVLEDSFADRVLLERYVPQWGYTTIFATCCSEFECLIAGDFYAAILDNNVPKRVGGPIMRNQGLPLAYRLRTEKPEAIIILHTTELEDRLIEELVSSGIYYVKKGDYDRLRSVLDSV
ncbi:response regulator [Candidatus Woesearchaeota archaeon]|nr:response regulator [Candidatus Woesearchaeota archaeon]